MIILKGKIRELVMCKGITIYFLCAVQKGAEPLHPYSKKLIITYIYEKIIHD